MKLFFTLILALILAACGTTPKVEHHYKSIVIEIPANLISNCPVAPPPRIQEYLQANAERREEMWVEVYKETVQYVADCNIRMKAARDWNESQKKIYSEEKKE